MCFGITLGVHIHLQKSLLDLIKLILLNKWPIVIIMGPPHLHNLKIVLQLGFRHNKDLGSKQNFFP